MNIYLHPSWVKKELKNAYIGEYPWPLCFTANTAGSTVQLKKTGGPTSVTLETSTDWNTWSTYTIWTTITLSNIWDKIYWRNTSETDTWFGIDGSNYYTFAMTGSIAGSWDINYLLNKNSTTTVSSSCYRNLFYNCTSLTTVPELPATTLADYCYHYMFAWCTWLTIAPELPATTMKSYCYGGMFSNCSSLTTAPSLPATTLDSYCYQYMFYNCTNLVSLPELPAATLSASCYQYMFRSCSKIKLSTTQTGEYQTAYRIPKTWTWTTASNALWNMFQSTWWTFTWTPSINTTYYTSNTVV